MRTVQMTLEPELLRAVDRTAKKLGTTRSAFTRQALREALDRLQRRALDRQDREGYARKPVRAGEFGAWESEQVWPEW